MKKLILKNYFLWQIQGLRILDLQTWLDGLTLSGRESRFRTRFLNLLIPRIKEIYSEQNRLFEEYGARDKENRLIYFDQNGNETGDKKSGVELKLKDNKGKTDFNQEWESYLKEDFVLDVRPETEETIKEIKKIILNTKEEFSGLMANRYNEWCEAFEF